MACCCYMVEPEHSQGPLIPASVLLDRVAPCWINQQFLRPGTSPYSTVMLTSISNIIHRRILGALSESSRKI